MECKLANDAQVWTWGDIPGRQHWINDGDSDGDGDSNRDSDSDGNGDGS